jgi:hypothetical protein
MAQLIIVLFGIQFRDSDWPNSKTVLTENCDVKAGATDTFTFPKGAGAKAKYEVQVKFDLADFGQAIGTPNAVVVYDGHSRFGRGPCFGPAGIAQMPDAKSFPINPWDMSYKMGYDATATECEKDLLHHSVLPTEYDLTTAASTAFLGTDLMDAAAEVQANEQRLKAKKIKAGTVCRSKERFWRKFDLCLPEQAATPTQRGDRPMKGRHFYQIVAGKKKESIFNVSIAAGAADLDKSKLPGKLLVLASCSSHMHFFDALDRRRKAANSGCKFILTSDLCYADLATVFLKRVLLDKIDPTTSAGMAKLTKALNGMDGSGGVGLY